MIIVRLKNDNGEFRCFEVDNRVISRYGMAQVVSKLQGVKISRYPRFYDDEVFCEFEFGGKKFEITEPYGDSSVYDVVAPIDGQCELAKIAEHFEMSPPIKGGDIAHNMLFFMTSIVWPIFVIAFVIGVAKLVRIIFS